MQYVKCVLVGDQYVGKTCMFKMYAKDAFPGEYIPTTAGFRMNPVDVRVDGRPVHLEVWDTPARFPKDDWLPHFDYAQTDIFLLVFSLIDRDCYTNVSEKWIGELKHHCPGARVILVGTKLDLRAVNDASFDHISTEEGEALAKRIGAICYLECSALTRQNVNIVFDKAIRMAVIGSTELSKKSLFSNLAILRQLPAKLQLISKIQDSMDDLLKHVKICCTLTVYLVTESQQRSNRIRDWFSERMADPYLGKLNTTTVMSHNWESVFILLDRFICCMVAGEDLLSFCAKEDWKTVALSLFLPTSCESTYSKFSLVTHDLDRAGDMLLNLLEAPAIYQSSVLNEKAKAKWNLGNFFEKFLWPTAQESEPDNDTMEAEVIIDEVHRYQYTCDREHVLSKLESESSNIVDTYTKTQSSGINETTKAKWSLGYIYQSFFGPTTQELQLENDSMEAEIITEELCRHATNQKHVLSKLESGSSNLSSDLDIYGPLLRKRLQGDLHAEGASLVPICFWIPGKLQYVYQDVAGEGSSKTVLKCTWLGQQVAIAVYSGEYAKLDLESEAGVLARVQHPNVVNLIGCAYDNTDQKGYLVTELMEQDLRQLIRKSRRGYGQMTFSLSVSMDIILQIIEAMIHMRKCRVSHRDLKPQNCLVSMKKSSVQKDLEETYYVVKLIDFGSAKLHRPDTSICYTRKQGSTAYMAPEVHGLTNDCQYTWSADVYSFGMTCYEIISGKYPFEGQCMGSDLVKRVCAGKRPEFSKSCPVFWKQLIEKCWHQIPERRPSFISIRKEIWECYDKLV